MENNKRFFRINSEYVYDSVTNNLGNISDDVIERINTNKSSKNLKGKEKEVFNLLKNAKETEVLSKKNSDETFVTICYSNRCNLNCTYCYRNKQNNTKELKNEDFERIADYVINQYNPNSKVYVFSLGLSSEPMLEIEKIQNFQNVLSKYDGSLFSESDFLGISPKEVFDNLPVKIKDKYINNNDYIKSINSVLKTERLAQIYNIKPGCIYKGFNSLLENEYLCQSKLAFLNRKILEYVYGEKIKRNESKYFAISFFSNGTLIDEEKAQIIKGLDINEMHISLDGDEEINNSSRRYYDGTGSYRDVIKGIKNLQKYGIKIIISTVITPEYPSITRIIQNLRMLHLDQIKFNILREENGYSFTKDKLQELLKDFDALCELMIEEFKNDNFELLHLLRDSLLINPIMNIVFKNKYIHRCNWGENLVIDSEGNMYPCLYTMGNKTYSYGNYKEGKKFSQIYKPILVSDKKTCKLCWARYLCGGSCHYAGLASKNSPYETDEIECMYRKGLIKCSLKMMTELINHGLLKTVIQHLIKE